MSNYKYDKAVLRVMKDNYFKAKTLYERIKEKADEIQRKVLAENPFYMEDDVFELRKRKGYDGDKRIYNPDDTYLFVYTDDYQRYLDLIYAEYVKAGIADSRGRDYIPESRAKELLWESERQLIEYGINMTPDEYADQKFALREVVKIDKYRNKMLDFVLSLECC